MVAGKIEIYIYRGSKKSGKIENLMNVDGFMVIFMSFETHFHITFNEKIVFKHFPIFPRILNFKNLSQALKLTCLAKNFK